MRARLQDDIIGFGLVVQVHTGFLAHDADVPGNLRFVEGQLDVVRAHFDGAGDTSAVKGQAHAAGSAGDYHAGRIAAQGDRPGGVDDGQAVRGVGARRIDIGADGAVKHGHNRRAAGGLHGLEHTAVVADRDAARSDFRNIRLRPRLIIADRRREIGA